MLSVIYIIITIVVCIVLYGRGSRNAVLDYIIYKVYTQLPNLSYEEVMEIANDIFTELKANKVFGIKAINFSKVDSAIEKHIRVYKIKQR